MIGRVPCPRPRPIYVETGAATPRAWACAASTTTVFGVVPNLLDGELIIRPGLPSEWPSSSLDTLDVGYICTRQGSLERHAIRSRLQQPVRLRIRVAARVIFRVTNVSPRLGDSWLKKMPLHAKILYPSL